MGTRSLLAFEMKNGNYSVQYMQFDGYPSTKGREYYETIMESLTEIQGHFISKSGKPKGTFFRRILHFLNNYQYGSGHSMGERFSIPPSEWQYLFKRNGDFVFFNHYSSNYTCTIPWEFSCKLVRIAGREAFQQRLGKPSNLMPFWDALDEWKPGKEKRCLVLKSGQSLQFPDQGKNGYRDFGALYYGKKKLCESLFQKENCSTEEISTLFESDYTTVKETPYDELPLLIGN